jgi:DNA-binding MarR family transcriptional regulator
MTQVLSPLGQTIQQYNVLRIDNGQFTGGIKSSGIQERMLDKHSDVSRSISRLMKAGWLAKCVNPKNRRAVHILITQEGRNLVKKIMGDEYHSLLLIYFLNDAEAAQLKTLFRQGSGLKSIA